MERLEITDIRAILARLARIMSEKRDELIALDGAMGDGDLGLTMEKGFSAAAEEAAKADETDAGRLLMKAGMAIARTAPSTMGTLVGSGFMSGGKAVMGKTSLDGKDLAAFFDAFAAGVMQRGKAQPGDKTLLDVLLPAAGEFSGAVSAGKPLAEAARSLHDGAARGLAESKEMTAQHGRLAYYQEKSKGRDDPGAVAATYILQGFVEHCSSG